MPRTKPFNKLLRSMNEEYLGKPVPKQYRKRYGKIYDKKEVLSFAIATAKSKGITIDKKQSK